VAARQALCRPATPDSSRPAESENGAAVSRNQLAVLAKIEESIGRYISRVFAAMNPAIRHQHSHGLKDRCVGQDVGVISLSDKENLAGLETDADRIARLLVRIVGMQDDGIEYLDRPA